MTELLLRLDHNLVLCWMALSGVFVAAAAVILPVSALFRRLFLEVVKKHYTGDIQQTLTAAMARIVAAG